MCILAATSSHTNKHDGIRYSEYMPNIHPSFQIVHYFPYSLVPSTCQIYSIPFKLYDILSCIGI